jgi:hypothetical protein
LSCNIMLKYPVLGTLAVLMPACADWPRYGNLPEAPSNLVPSETDPRDMFEIEWEQFNENSGETGDLNDDPVTAGGSNPPPTLELGSGTSVSGSLSRIGWNQEMGVPSFPEVECEPQDAFQTVFPADNGYYIGDVDFYVFSTGDLGESSALLCGMVKAGPLVEGGTYTLANAGWDLLLFELDDCMVPKQVFSSEGEEALGYGMGGAEGYWSIPVAGGKQYAVLFASYTDPTQEGETATDGYNYTLGAAIINGSQTAAAVCPNLPSAPESE